MKTLWNVISFLAVVHLLALAIFIAWLWNSKRLSLERVHDVREMFTVTVADAKAATAKAAAEAQAEHDKKIQQEKDAHPPLDSAMQIQSVSLIQQQEEQSRRRLEDEKKTLAQQLAAATGQLDQKRADLDRQRVAWENLVRDDRQRKQDGQFLQTVKQYEQVSPKQGKKMIVELVNQKQIDQAVAYLDAMNARAASKILKEFKTDPEITLATELLEKLRTFGVGATKEAEKPPPAPAAAAPPVQPGAAGSNAAVEPRDAHGLANVH